MVVLSLWRTLTSTSVGRLASTVSFLFVVAVLRHATGSGTGVAALVLLPVLWIAGRGSRLELAVAAAAVAAVFIVPIVAIGSPRYPASEWPVAVFVSAMAALAGVLVHQLVERVRRQERDARRRHHETERLLVLLRNIARAEDVRAAVCEAAREVCGGSACVLLERRDDERVDATGAAGAAIDGMPHDREVDELLLRVDRAERGEFLTDPRAALGAHLFASLDRPACAAVEPIRGHGLTAAMVVALPAAAEYRQHVLALLAAEAASEIARADVVAELESLARIDPLTGLPNRRAWEESLTSGTATAAREHKPLTVALIDIDGFKQFNDAHGHQAGDRLLKRAAAAWRVELRDGDVLARWGGDEFAVLITATHATARQVLQRLRDAVPEHEFSIGVAAWRPGDNAEGVLGRADADLYAAKAATRTRDGT